MTRSFRMVKRLITLSVTMFIGVAIVPAQATIVAKATHVEGEAMVYPAYDSRI